MKVFDLCCSSGHRFEGWFASLEELERQRDSGLLTCPECGSSEVQRLPNAAHIAAERMREAEAEKLAEARRALMAAVRDQAERAEDVGDRFVDESRAIAHNQAPRRVIKGRCSSEQAEELWEEGIAVLPVPESSGKTIN